MNAKKCDRCGSYYEPSTTDDIGKTTIQRLQWVNMVELSICFDDYNTRVVRIDMCPECMKKQVQFLQESPLINGKVKKMVYLTPLTQEQIEKLDGRMVEIIPKDMSCEQGIGYIDILDNRINCSSHREDIIRDWPIADLGTTYDAYGIPGESVPIEAEVEEVSRMAETKNLQEELLDQITRVQELSDITASYPGGQIAAEMMRQDISTAKEAMNHVDIAAMITACAALRGWEE